MTKQQINDYQNQYQKNNREKFNDYRKRHWADSSLVRLKQNCRHKTKLKFKSRNKDYKNQVCEVNGCNEHGVIHHWDYNECLDISFLCKEHHLQAHQGVELNLLRHF